MPFGNVPFEEVGCGLPSSRRVYARRHDSVTWQPFFACDRHVGPLSSLLKRDGWDVAAGSRPAFDEPVSLATAGRKV
jgi:hypothetical protein